METSKNSARERILADAKINDESKGREIPGVTDDYGQRWTKLESYHDLLTVYDLMSAYHKKAATTQRAALMREIKAGVTFGFFHRNGELWWER